MIQCPNCGQDVADDAAHCGHCGHKLQASTGMKTMFGFAAVSPEEMRQAAEEAKALKAASGAPIAQPQPTADAGSDAPTQALPATPDPKTVPSASIPKPSNFKLPQPTATLGEESSSVFDLPKPGGDQPATINVQSVGPTPTDAPEPAWATGSDTDPNLAPASNLPGSSMPGSSASQPPPGAFGAPAETIDEAARTKPENMIATAANARHEPTFDMTPGPVGGALQKKGPPVALIAGIGVILLIFLCIVGTAIGLMFL